MAHRVELRARANQHFVYSGRSLLVTNLDGQVVESGTEGFYVENTRLLSRYELTIGDRPLLPVAASPVGGAGFLAYVEAPEAAGVPAQAVYVEIAHVVGGGMRSEIRIENYHVSDTARFHLRLHLAADFADSEEVDQGDRQQAGDVETRWDPERRELLLRYCHPELDRAVAIRVEQSPAPVRYADGALVASLRLPPHESEVLRLVIEPLFDGVRRRATPVAFAADATPLGRVRQRLRDETTELETTNATVTRAWQTAVADLASLPLGAEDGPATPIAGLPLYQQFFGRDSLTIGWQAGLALSTMLRDTLRANAAMQGTAIDDWLDEEPGKMIHQARRGPLSVLGIDPFIRYYGDYATPQDFLIGLGQYLGWTNDRATVRALLPTARRALDWLERYGDLDGDGLLEYVCRSRKGVENQGWKDSNDAIVDERGAIVHNPIATCEIQGYWFAALQQAAASFFACGDRVYAVELLRKARQLQRRFDAAFWMPDEGFYALALGPDKQQIRSIASNAGQVLATGIVPRDKGRQVARRLLEPDLFSGWGIRTLSSAHVAYNPFSYHLGSVWPVENATIVFGLARYGCVAQMQRLAEGFFASTELFAANRLPEAIGGLPRDEAHPHPGIYRKSNAPQGWSASAVVLVIQALLGMRPVAPLDLLLVDPRLPDWLPELRLRGVRLGQTRFDLQFRRGRDGATRYRVTGREGVARLLRQPVPQGAEASPGGRLRAALASLPRS